VRRFLDGATLSHVNTRLLQLYHDMRKPAHRSGESVIAFMERWARATELFDEVARQEGRTAQDGLDDWQTYLRRKLPEHGGCAAAEAKSVPFGQDPPGVPLVSFDESLSGRFVLAIPPSVRTAFEADINGENEAELLSNDSRSRVNARLLRLHHAVRGPAHRSQKACVVFLEGWGVAMLLADRVGQEDGRDARDVLEDWLTSLRRKLRSA
jgi:hypothetical protein